MLRADFFIHLGDLIMITGIVRACILAFVIAVPASGIAAAGTAYDGSWSLSIMTERGNCDRNYYFQVRVINGIVSHANLVRFTGRVSSGGWARVSVSVMDKHASGSGKLSQTSGRGRWTGRSGNDRCSGSWTAQRS
jgi:hypothetical protein